MYKVILGLFLTLTIASSFASKPVDKKYEDPRVGRPGPAAPHKNEFKDEVVRGESATEHRADARPGSRRDLNKGVGVTTGVNCTTGDGKVITPKDKLYTNCVDNANRIK